MNNKILCILCCCLYPTNSYSNISDSRIEQYIIGLTKFFKYNDVLKTNNVDIFVIDNSINEGKVIDNRILEILPNNVKLITHSNNKHGAINKGAGLIENWLHSTELLKEYHWLIHFEPRQHINSFNFIESFFKNPRNLFTLGENKKHFNTGLFCIRTDDLISYLNLVNLNVMVVNHISIEYDIYNFIINNNIQYDLESKMDLIWFDDNTPRNM